MHKCFFYCEMQHDSGKTLNIQCFWGQQENVSWGEENHTPLINS